MTSPIPSWVADWYSHLETASWSGVVSEPGKTIVVSADMIVGFCVTGTLASERVGGLAPTVRSLFERAYDVGVRDFALLQDTHHPETPEFGSWPPHCIRGTDEAETIVELESLPFSDRFAIIEKNSLSPGHGTTFDDWLDARGNIRTAIVVGNCTDLCVYSAAMHLRLRANAELWNELEVVVPANCVDTYDLPMSDALAAGVFAHPGDFYHQVFLHHMALNGIRVVSGIE